MALNAVYDRRVRSTLTARQREALGYVAKGYSYAGAGAAMGIDAGTAKDHARAVRRKLGAHTNAHAVHLAHLAGLLNAEADHEQK